MDLDADLTAYYEAEARSGRRSKVGEFRRGLWGGLEFEGIVPFGDLRPDRFFSLTTHDRWREMLARHGDVETFETHDPAHDDGWEYQFAIVRAQA